MILYDCERCTDLAAAVQEAEVAGVGGLIDQRTEELGAHVARDHANE